MADVFDAFIAKLARVKRQGDRVIACCPAHDDRQASLSATRGADGRVLVKCHAGCATERIVERLGLTMGDLFPAKTNGNGIHAGGDPTHRPALIKTYDYVDEHGTLLFQSCRFAPKTFRQRRPDGRGGWVWDVAGVRLVPYRLPEVLEAVSLGKRIYVVEGEKDADALASFGFVATTNPMGARKWRDEYSQYLAGADVVVFPDNDDIGREHAEQVAASLTAAGCRVRVVALPGIPVKGDVSDWLDAGGDFDDLESLIGQTRVWTTDPLRRTRWRLDELWENDVIMRPPPPVVPRLAWRARSTLLAAQEKSGKSTLVGFVAAQVSRGGSFLGEPCDRGDVLVVGLEEYVGDLARRLRHFDADPVRIHIVPELPGDPRERPQVLRAHVEAVRPVLVIVDTLMAYAEGLVSDASSSAQMQPVVQQLTRLAHELEVALVLDHHARKSDGRYRDSSAIGGAVDCILEMFAPDEDTDPPLRQMRARGRVPVHSYRFRYTGDDYLLDEGAAAPLEQRVVSYVRSCPGCRINDVADAVTGRREAILRLIQAMLVDGRLMSRGNGSARQLYVPGPRPATLPLEAPNVA